MVRGFTILAVWAMALGAFAASPPAAGEQLARLGPNGEPGIINSINFIPADPQATIAVRPMDDSKESLEIKRRIDAALREAGYAVSDYTADIELSFETEVIEGRFSGESGTLGSLRGGGGGVRLDFNIWSSSKDSLLGGRQRRDDRRANVFHMNAVLRDRESGAVLWQGDAFYEMLIADHARIANSMVWPLVRNLGRTVRREPFQIE